MKAVLTIAGSDSSAGAGIQADLKTISFFGGFGICAVTGIVAEVPGDVRSIQMTDPDVLRDQLEVLLENFEIPALKTGMLGTAENAVVVADFLEKNPDITAVVDPVLIASAGQALSEAETVTVYRERILPRADLATPNLPEMKALLDCPDETHPREMVKEYFNRFSSPVLLKGGHTTVGNEAPALAVDLFFDGHEVVELTSPWLDVPDTHGTGCTLSAAIAARMADSDVSRADALREAKNYVHQAMENALVIGDMRMLNHSPSA